MTTIEDTIAVMLASPVEQTYRLRLLDRLEEETPNVRAAALALVLKHKDNDGPRLLYAEWCDRNGQKERGEFIRVQCELARIHNNSPKKNSEHNIALRCREQELLTVGSAKAWFSTDFARYGPIMVSGPTGYYESWGWWRRPGDEHMLAPPVRGFIEHVTCSAENWLDHGDAIMRKEPVERLTLTTWPDIDVAGIDSESWAMMGRDAAAMILSREFTRRWPGITVELPRADVHAHEFGHAIDVVSNSPSQHQQFADFVSEQLRDIAGALGLSPDMIASSTNHVPPVEKSDDED